MTIGLGPRRAAVCIYIVVYLSIYANRKDFLLHIVSDVYNLQTTHISPFICICLQYGSRCVWCVCLCVSKVSCRLIIYQRTVLQLFGSFLFLLRMTYYDQSIDDDLGGSLEIGIITITLHTPSRHLFFPVGGSACRASLYFHRDMDIRYEYNTHMDCHLGVWLNHTLVYDEVRTAVVQLLH